VSQKYQDGRMKGGSIFIFGVIAILIFASSPIDTIKSVGESLGITLEMILGVVLVTGLVVLIGGSKTPRRR